MKFFRRHRGRVRVYRVARTPRTYTYTEENVADNKQWDRLSVNATISKIGYRPRDNLCIKIINGVGSEVLQEK